MRALADKDRTVSPAEIVEMATVNGARALGLAGKIGELAPGALADLIAIPFSGKSANVLEAVLQHTGAVSASLIEGRWAIPRHNYTTPIAARDFRVFSGDSCKIARQPRAAPTATFSGRSSR